VIALEVNDMTCGHCARTITKAVNATDRNAKVTIDLSQHVVTIEPVMAIAEDLSSAVREAGCTRVPRCRPLP